MNIRNSLKTLSISIVVSSLLIGCGGSSSSSDTSTSTASNVTVERGAVYGTTVTDKNGLTAKDNGTNTYTFAEEPTYPITATGGIIDVDGNGVDEGDIKLTSPLVSYSKVISPITNYLGDTSSDEGKAKLEALNTKLGSDFSLDDLISKVPSEISNDALLLSNALFEDNLDGEVDLDSIGTSFENLRQVIDQSGEGMNLGQIAVLLEEQVVSNNGDKLTEASAEEIKEAIEQIEELLNNDSDEGTSFTLTSEMLEDSEFYLNPNDGTGREKFEFFSSTSVAILVYNVAGTMEGSHVYTWSIAEDGRLKITSSDGNTINYYKFNAKPADGVEVSATINDNVTESIIEEFSQKDNTDEGTSSSDEDSEETYIKFSTADLNGKTYYNVSEECENYDGNGNCTEANPKWQVGEFSFTDTKLTGKGITNTSDKIEVNYTITKDGYIRYYEDEEKSYMNIKGIEKTDDYISLIWTEEGDESLNSNVSNDEYFYFNLEKARARVTAEEAK